MKLFFHFEVLCKYIHRPFIASLPTLSASSKILSTCSRLSRRKFFLKKLWPLKGLESFPKILIFFFFTYLNLKRRGGAARTKGGRTCAHSARRCILQRCPLWSYPTRVKQKDGCHILSERLRDAGKLRRQNPHADASVARRNAEFDQLPGLRGF